jgi:hypothetical protein
MSLRRARRIEVMRPHACNPARFPGYARRSSRGSTFRATPSFCIKRSAFAGASTLSVLSKYQTCMSAGRWFSNLSDW